MPAVFALADKVIAQPQTSLFAAFGSFALLVLTEFTGPPRIRLLAYLGLGCVGAAFITLGTLCSRNEWLAAGVMAIVGFATLFAGVISGYVAAGATGALLTFVLPVNVPASNSAKDVRPETAVECQHLGKADASLRIVLSRIPIGDALNVEKSRTGRARIVLAPAATKSRAAGTMVQDRPRRRIRLESPESRRQG